MNKKLVIKTMELVEDLNIGSIVSITKEGKTSDYKLQIYNGDYELLSVINNDVCWDIYGHDNLENVKCELVSDAVWGNFEDIEII